MEIDFLRDPLKREDLLKFNGYLELAYQKDADKVIKRPGYLEYEFVPKKILTLLKSLDRNYTSCDQPSVEIELTNVLAANFLSYYVKENPKDKEERELSDIIQLEGNEIEGNSDKTCHYGYVEDFSWELVKRPYGDMVIYKLKDHQGILKEPLKIPGKNIQQIVPLYIGRSVQFD